MNREASAVNELHCLPAIEREGDFTGIFSDLFGDEVGPPNPLAQIPEQIHGML